MCGGVRQALIPPPSSPPLRYRHTGQVGWLIANMKNTVEARVGDTFFSTAHPVEPLPGFKPAKPMVFAGLYPINPVDLERLKDALQKLIMTDSAVTITKESR